MHLIEKIKESVLKNPAAPAFISNKGFMTYGQFYSLLSLIAKKLQIAGVKESEVIAVSMDQSAVHCATILAIASLGAVSIPILPDLDKVQREKLINNFNIKAIVLSSNIPDVPLLKNLKLGTLSFKVGEHTLDFLKKMPSKKAPARIALTSGTTGDPLGILYTLAMHRVLHFFLLI
jgi:acyl-CoA synthetase (AMP-forming)/AMP-acid ligase II